LAATKSGIRAIEGDDRKTDMRPRAYTIARLVNALLADERRIID
jgi:hypothetical protein